MALEGDSCYRFSTIRDYIQKTGSESIRTVVEIGVNVGGITLLINDCFPSARIYGYEAVEEYCEIATQRLKHLAKVSILPCAITSQHIYYDDLGRHRRPTPCPMVLLKASSGSGAGWLGGSAVLPETDCPNPCCRPGYEVIHCDLRPTTLQEVVEYVISKESVTEIDMLKMDCEGCENSVLGASSLDVLRKFRFIVGEYHNIGHFFNVMRNKLFQTHKVNLRVSSSSAGAFFCERLDGAKDGILKFDKTGMLQLRPWLAEFPLEWHVFNPEFV